MQQPLVKYPYIGGLDWVFFRLMDIPDYANPKLVYLRRFIIFKTPWFGLYLHIIFVADGDRDPHNHPMDFWSLVLWGGYEEMVEYWEDSVLYRTDWLYHTWLSFHAMKRLKGKLVDGYYHSIKRLFKNPTITLVFTGKRAESWGFMTENGFVDYKVYNHAEQTN